MQQLVELRLQRAQFVLEPPAQRAALPQPAAQHSRVVQGPVLQWGWIHIGDFTQRRFTERPVDTNVKKSTVSMALTNHETPFDVGIDATFSETSLHKVPIEYLQQK